MSQDRILQNTWNSTCSWRVRLVLAFKNIDSKYVGIKLQSGEDCDPAYINVNPSGVPTLTEPDGSVYTQSAAIMEYLEEVYPENAVLPTGAGQRALCRALSQEIISGIQPLQNMGVAYLHVLCRPTWNKIPAEKAKIMIGGKQVGACGEVTQMKYLRDVIIEKLWGVENLMTRCAGKYSCGDTFTIADAALIPQVHAAHHSFHVDISIFPTIARVLENLKQLPFVEATAPDNCPDSVGARIPLCDVGVVKFADVSS